MSETASRPRLRLLVVDDEPDLLTLYELTLLREGHDIDTARSLAEARERLQAGRYDLVLSDVRLPDGSGLELLQDLEAAGRGERVVVVTAYGSPDHAVQALQAGAYDYLSKPVDLRQLRSVVASALGRPPAAPAGAGAARPARPGLAPALRVVVRPEPAAEAPPAAAGALGRLVGRSPAVARLRARLAKVAPSMAPVLIQGESGTGKELVARALHERSARAAGPFVAVNCAAIPETLIEAELFGHRKGSFTGAQEDREGVFQAARGGTLFLDEIGDLPLAAQSRLLRAVQERAVRPVGATAEQPVDVRVVSATHRDLAAEVAAGRFRQDLYYRLNVIALDVPPLRERLEDLPALGEALLARLAREDGRLPPRLGPEALEALARHGLPGNVRELENRLHRALALAAGPVLGPADLGLAEDDAGAWPDPLDAEAAAPAPDAGLASLAGLAGLGLPAQGDGLPADLGRHLDEVERALLVRALSLHRGNRTSAGARLGLTLRQMRYRMARLGIQVGGPEEGEDPEPGA